jgi:hypothetical protein
MDASTATTALKLQPPSDHLAASPYVASRHSHSEDTRQALVSFNAAEIFKKPPCVADSKPQGRDVAKDVRELGGISKHTTFDVKLTGDEQVAGPTRWPSRATNPSPGALWMYAQQGGPAGDRAVAQPRRAHEKQCYADI